MQSAKNLRKSVLQYKSKRTYFEKRGKPMCLPEFKSSKVQMFNLEDYQTNHLTTYQPKLSTVNYQLSTLFNQLTKRKEVKKEC
jgi:uncharacterized protein YkuJ